MSSHTLPRKRLTAPDITAKKGLCPIIALTSYHAHTAKIVDKYADLILVGDSLGMVMHGMETTVGVPLELMIMHAQAVMRGTKHALVVVDMPFGSYEESPHIAFRNAARIMKETGCGGIKLEGGVRMAETVRFLTERGIPVMGHIGLTPQTYNVAGGFFSVGHNEKSWPAYETDAQTLNDAGAFSVVLEAMVEPLARKITHQSTIPTIGIGASPHCDGQIMVLEDMLGFNKKPPRFVKQYAQLENIIANAVRTYADEVKNRTFPSEDNLYKQKQKN